MNKEIFIEELKKINVDVNEEQISKLDIYLKNLLKWNEKINLTNIIKTEDIYLKHFYDSITLIKAIDLNKNIKVCDIGTGAGFPGLVLKIIFPNISINLVDSLGKRINFLEDTVKLLDLFDIEIINSRAEDYIRNHIEEFDLITCRAVSKLNIISEICLPGVKLNGYFIPMKGKIEEEIKNTKYLNKLGSKLENIISFKLPIENSERNLIVIKKYNKIDLKYPREFNKILKNPL